MTRRAVDAEVGNGLTTTADSADSADHDQAEYYRCLLSEHCREVDRRIASYQAAVTRYAARGNLEDARRVRRMMRVEERQRQTLARMIDSLNERFPQLAGNAEPAQLRSRLGTTPLSAMSGRARLPR